MTPPCRSYIDSACNESAGNVTVRGGPIVVDDEFDGGCQTFIPDWGDCGQQEGQAPVFRSDCCNSSLTLEDNVSFLNVPAACYCDLQRYGTPQ